MPAPPELIGHARIYTFPTPQDREGRQPGARRSPLRSTAAPECRRPVSSLAQDWAWTQPVDGPRLLVLLALAKRVRPKSDQATPSMPELAQLTGMSETTIRGHVQALAKANVIHVEVSNGGRHQRSTYTLPGVLTPRELWGSKPVKTPREATPKNPETPRIPRQNPPAAAPVVLRTKWEQEVVSTSDASASAEDQGELFDVDRPPPVKAARALAVIERKELAQANAGDATAAWCDGYGETHDAKPTARQIGQAAREARQLLEAGNPPERVVYAARMAGGRGLATVEREYNALAKRRDVAQPAAHAAPARPSTTDSRVAAGIALAEKYARQEAG